MSTQLEIEKCLKQKCARTTRQVYYIQLSCVCGDEPEQERSERQMPLFLSLCFEYCLFKSLGLLTVDINNLKKKQKHDVTHSAKIDSNILIVYNTYTEIEGM